MFATRFYLPAIRAATRRYTTSARLHSPFVTRQTSFQLFTAHLRPSNIKWQTVYRQAQHRHYAAYNYRRFQQSGSLLRRWAARPTFYYEIGGIGLVCGGYYISHLETVPVSGRRRFNIISPQFEEQAGEEIYKQTLQEFGDKILPQYTREHQMVQRVLNRLIPHSGLQNEDWRVHVIDDDTKNAFVIPGGKVFVFRGILDVCQGDDGLAAVLGHEIAHNVAHHSAEKMSEMYVFAPIGILLSLFSGIDYNLISTVSSLALSLPHSRRQEEEADYIGLLMMAESCYDPTAAIGLWARMEQSEQGAPPQFLSTHPSSHNRLEKIRGWIPQAEQRSEESGCHVTSGYARDFQGTVGSQRW